MLQLRLLYLLWIVQQIYNDPQQIKTSEICHTHHRPAVAAKHRANPQASPYTA